jgi:hypothetical protein
MSDSNKTIVIAVMWFSVALLELPVAGSGHFGFGFIFPLLLATFLTLTVWIAPTLSSIIESRTEKAKRSQSDSLSALMELMDEDERQEFKQQLKQRMLDNVSRGSVDGELPLDSESLESLLDEENTEYKGYQS